ncbi:MAG TPA: glycosyltransferase [Nocardioides sp.]|nr:glycosyltransferase [Nocardioides sp.]
MTWLRDAGARRWIRAHRLSVVVPVFNLAESLGPCLESILGQPVPDLEVVVIDDGSTDDSADVAAQWAAKDPRVVLVRQENGGVSRARNVGIERCTGDLVTFVDPDDTLPDDAWRPLLTSLARTGSDFAVGMMERVDGSGRRVRPPLLHRNHAERRLRETVSGMPLVLADVFPCNKVFRMDFWRRHDLRFPEGVRYEDQVLCTDAFLASTSFDVLTETVYEWQVRDDLSSATQRRGALDNLRDRILTKQMTIERVLAFGDAEVTRTLYASVLPIDMWEHFRAAVAPGTESPDTYWQLLREGLLAIWNDATVRFEDTELPAGQRLMGWLVGEDRRSDLVRLLAEIDGPGVPVEDGRYLHPWYDDPAVPAVLGRTSR